MPWDKFSAAGNQHRVTSVNKIGLALTSKGSESKVIEYRRNLSVVDKVFFLYKNAEHVISWDGVRAPELKKPPPEVALKDSNLFGDCHHLRQTVPSISK